MLWAKEAQRNGLRTFSLPTFETRPIRSYALTHALQSLNSFDWLVLTSGNAATYLSKTKKWNVVRKRAPRVAVVGLETRREAMRVGLRVTFAPQTATASSLGLELPRCVGKKILILRSKIASKELSRVLRARGAFVTDIAMYDTHLLRGHNTRLERHVDRDNVGSIVFASPSAIQGYMKRVSRVGLKYSRTLPVVVIGTTTEKAAKKARFKDVHVARPFTFEGIIRTLQKLL